MDRVGAIQTPDAPSESQKTAFANLLADEDEAVYRAVHSKLLSLGPTVRTWLRPHTLSNDPLLRRRAQQIVHYFDQQEADDQFLAFCLQHGEQFDLEQGAWLLARTQYPEINVEGYQALLDSFATTIRGRIDLNDEAARLLGCFNEYFFGELGFCGNELDYYSPENSYLNRVLDKRTGNPISLSLVYMLLARRLHLPVTGIGLPSHFICRYQSTSAEVYIDTFNRGKLLTKGDCVQYLLRANYSLQDDYLVPVTARRILQRICNNLHQIYLHQHEGAQTTRMQRYIIALSR